MAATLVEGGDPMGSGFDPTTLGLPADFRLTNYSALCVPARAPCAHSSGCACPPPHPTLPLIFWPRSKG